MGAVVGLGLAGLHEDECATVPDLCSLVILPWDNTQAWLYSDLHNRDEPYRNDPRSISL